MVYQITNGHLTVAFVIRHGKVDCQSGQKASVIVNQVQGIGQGSQNVFSRSVVVCDGWKKAYEESILVVVAGHWRYEE